MQSLYVVFPEKEKVEVRQETMTPPEPDEVLCAAEKSLPGSLCCHWGDL
jgi:hypothetical protein